MVSINRTAAKATGHCLLGCSIGEVLGMILTTVAKLSTAPSVAISIGLAFIFGYGLSISPLLGHGMSGKKALRLALAADTASITTMELADNIFILVIPGAINADLQTKLFWISLACSLVVALW